MCHYWNHQFFNFHSAQCHSVTTVVLNLRYHQCNSVQLRQQTNKRNNYHQLSYTYFPRSACLVRSGCGKVWFHCVCLRILILTFVTESGCGFLFGRLDAGSAIDGRSTTWFCLHPLCTVHSTHCALSTPPTVEASLADISRHCVVSVWFAHHPPTAAVLWRYQLLTTITIKLSSSANARTATIQLQFSHFFCNDNQGQALTIQIKAKLRITLQW